MTNRRRGVFQRSSTGAVMRRQRSNPLKDRQPSTIQTGSPEPYVKRPVSGANPVSTGMMTTGERPRRPRDDRKYKKKNVGELEARKQWAKKMWYSKVLSAEHSPYPGYDAFKEYQRKGLMPRNDAMARLPRDQWKKGPLNSYADFSGDAASGYLWSPMTGDVPGPPGADDVPSREKRNLPVSGSRRPVGPRDSMVRKDVYLGRYLGNLETVKGEPLTMAERRAATKIYYKNNIDMSFDARQERRQRRRSGAF